MENAGEDRVKGALDHIGLGLVARNHVLYRLDGSKEREVDLVYAHESHTFVIEVSANAQPDARRIKRRKLRERNAGGLFARLSSPLGLPASNRPCAVYVDLSRPMMGEEEPTDFNGGITMGDGHMDKLLSEPPQRGLSAFLEWNGISRGPGSP